MMTPTRGFFMTSSCLFAATKLTSRWSTNRSLSTGRGRALVTCAAFALDGPSFLFSLSLERTTGLRFRFQRAERLELALPPQMPNG